MVLDRDFRGKEASTLVDEVVSFVVAIEQKSAAAGAGSSGRCGVRLWDSTHVLGCEAVNVLGMAGSDDGIT